MTLQDAMVMIQRRRPQAQPIPAFMDYLQQQDELLQDQRAKSRADDPKLKNVPTMYKHGNADEPPTKRQKRQPIGPAGPILRPATAVEENPSSPSVIGPSLPPSIHPSQSIATRTDATIGPELPPSSSSSTTKPPGNYNTPMDGNQGIPFGSKAGTGEDSSRSSHD
jgi:hypothetical protein